MTTNIAETEERADQASKNKRSILFTTILKLFFSILFTVGTAYQHSNEERNSVCYKCDDDFYGVRVCTSKNEYVECMKPYKFGPMIAGAIVFFLSIIIETFWVNYKLFLEKNLIKNVMCGVYAMGSLVIIVAAILEVDMDNHLEYNDNDDENILAAWSWLWIVGGILCVISQLYWAWVLKSKNVKVLLAYIPAIVASVLWIIARGFLRTDYLFTHQSDDDDDIQLQFDLMIAASALYIFHALLWFCAVNGTVSSPSKLKSQAQAQAQLEEGLKVMK